MNKLMASSDFHVKFSSYFFPVDLENLAIGHSLVISRISRINRSWTVVDWKEKYFKKRRYIYFLQVAISCDLIYTFICLSYGLIQILKDLCLKWLKDDNDILLATFNCNDIIYKSTSALLKNQNCWGKIFMWNIDIWSFLRFDFSSACMILWKGSMLKVVCLCVIKKKYFQYALSIILLTKGMLIVIKRDVEWSLSYFFMGKRSIYWW